MPSIEPHDSASTIAVLSDLDSADIVLGKDADMKTPSSAGRTMEQQVLYLTNQLKASRARYYNDLDTHHDIIYDLKLKVADLTDKNRKQELRIQELEQRERELVDLSDLDCRRYSSALQELQLKLRKQSDAAENQHRWLRRDRTDMRKKIQELTKGLSVMLEEVDYLQRRFETYKSTGEDIWETHGPVVFSFDRVLRFPKMAAEREPPRRRKVSFQHDFSTLQSILGPGSVLVPSRHRHHPADTNATVVPSTSPRASDDGSLDPMDPAGLRSRGSSLPSSSSLESNLVPSLSSLELSQMSDTPLSAVSGTSRPGSLGGYRGSPSSGGESEDGYLSDDTVVLESGRSSPRSRRGAMASKGMDSAGFVQLSSRSRGPIAASARC